MMYNTHMNIKETSLVNYAVYNAGMKKSLLDKIFFMDKVDAELFVDYGCADGSLIKFLRALFPEYEYFGYDISEEMIAIAKENNPEIQDHFSTDWAFIRQKVEESQKKSAVVLSSIIHEVYSYGTITDVEEFWKRIFGDGFDFIVLRDMMPSKTMDRSSDINDIAKIYKRANHKNLFDFENTWGSIENNKSMTHFLLKYRYTENWDREVRENYIPITREDFLSTIDDSYEITFHEHFTLPFFKTIVKKDFDIDLKDNTHLKLVLKRKYERS